MSHARLRRNRCLLPLVLVGVSFCLTAWLYAMFTLRAKPASVTAETSELMRLMRDWGVTMLAVELVLLAVCVLGAVLADRR